MEASYYIHVINRQPVVVQRGLGARVWDVEGKEYLDFTAGWAVNNLGHCHPAVVQAVQEQAGTLMHMSNQFYTLPQLELAEALMQNSCMDKVFFCNSGAEANEGAVKLARKYGRLHRGGAQEVITALNSFHGRTLAMVAATGQPHFQEPWRPLAPGFVNVEYDNLDAVRAATSERTCAVMVEVLQGEGGVNVPSEGYIQGLRDWCDANGLVLIFDEVQTGLGRLGELFGYQAFGVEPDVMTLAKALGNGAPIGAFLCKDQYDVLEPGDHGTTFGGNALTCAAANAAVRYMVEHDVPSHAKRIGRYLFSSLEQLHSRHLDMITEVRGMGLLLAVGFSDTIAAKVVSACNSEGLLLNPVKPNAIRLMPPLIITEADADEAVVKLDQGLAKVKAG
uniref:Putative aminotransferase class-III n=1 Tax=uncultured marine microorganism HF4000_APKG7H23 TaxID=455551 RepID=B3T9W1_9ZZZZ|nr:putative aminotransferase class-III [uncultured marine microorganism HF4000_APKG7H23]